MKTASASYEKNTITCHRNYSSYHATQYDQNLFPLTFGAPPISEIKIASYTPI